ncbi:unnamed protein product [Calypogeia fissa]
MVAMVVEKMSVERMYKKMKKAKTVEPITPNNTEQESVVQNPNSKKKKKKEDLVEESVAVRNVVSSADERVEEMPKKKKKKMEEKAEPEDTFTRSHGASIPEEAVDKVQKKREEKKKMKKGELDHSATQSKGGLSQGKPLSPKVDTIQDREKKKLEKKEKKDKRREKRQEKNEKQKQKMGNLNKNVKGKQTVASKAQEEPSSDIRVKVAASVPEPVGMQIYWNLSNVDASVREAASVALVKELIGAQKDYEDRGLGQEEKAAEAVILGEAKVEEDGLKDCAPAVQYALRRLVRGVASSRESARQGFSLALAAVLGALPCIHGTAILNMVDKHLEVTSAMKGQESRDALLGQLFAYGALVRSSRVIGTASTVEQQELAKEVTERLLSLAKKKTFLQEAAVSVLVEVGEKLDGPELLKSVWASTHLTDCLKEGEDSIGPESLFLALRFHSKLPKSAFESCKVIPDSGNLIEIFEKDHLMSLLPCLKESTSSHPRVHLVWDPLLQILFSEVATPKSGKKNKRSLETGANLGTRLETFWSTVVDGSLLASSHERKHLAMQLLLMFLPRLPASSDIQYLLSKNFIQCLLGATASKENLLFKAAQNCIAELCKWAENDDERRIRVVLALQQSSQGKFDHLSKTQSVKGLLAGLTTITGYQSTFQALSRLYLFGETVEGDKLFESSLASKKQKVPVGDAEGGGEKDVIGDPLQQRWAVDQLRALCQQALGSLPANVVIEELVAKFVPSLTPVQPFTEEEEESIGTLQNTMLQVSSGLVQVESGEKKDRLQAMLSLIMQLLFESRLVPSIAVEIASEITICCKKAFGDLVELEVESPEDGEEPAFMDVLVDVLLSLLAQPSAPIRAAAEQVFKSFSGDLTSSGLTDLLRIVKKNTQRSRHKPVVEVDAQKDDDDDILDVEENDEGSEDGDGIDEDEAEDDDNEDSEGSDDDGDEEDTKVQAGTKTIRAEENKHDEEEDDEDKDEDEDNEEETSDLDDETMFRMDKHLASILKQRKQGGASGTDDSKDAQTQLMHFKFRVLALLDFFLQKHSGSLLVLTMLPSLLHVFVNSCTTDGNSQVADRVSSILQNKLFKGKQYPKGPEVDQTSLKDLLRKALKLASRSTVKRVSVMAQAACYWILKVIHGNLNEEKDKDVEEMFSAALDDFFMHKKCRLPSSFFKEAFTRNQWLGNCLVGAVLEKCINARTEYLQFEALQLAGTILGFKNGKFLTRSKQPDASLDTLAKALEPHLPSLSEVIVHHLKGASSAKAARRIEAIQFCVSALELYQALYPRKSLAKFIDSHASLGALDAITAPSKSKLNNLVVRGRQLLEKK